ncbi:hypothetical protein ROHU_002934 [Labeo rohita]|uniref:Ig-like domain-containing protein n=1 Tax=Labeo rohita TaxID=84645 RepID=A0A498NXL8_LABRO|nr:hypothetical protein ROHU_002934 [Labeo rohita]
MRASCSSEGEQLLYSWTLNGDSLMDGNSSIDLNEGTDGNITCSVKNHVSHGQKTINVKSCPAPIGSVEVSIICSSSGVMRASCSSEGDQLLYNWTLNGDSLTDGNSSIDLNEGTDGNITCSVKNHVSHGQKTINVKPCPGPTTTSVTSTVNCVDVVQREKAAPIGSVIVSIICSSSGVMRASCSSEGDQLLYNWTLNGDSLMDGNSSVDLNEGTDGNITCSVKNHVSHGQKTINVKSCPGEFFIHKCPRIC